MPLAVGIRVVEGNDLVLAAAQGTLGLVPCVRPTRAGDVRVAYRAA
jgi:hypothetical protein